MKRTIMAATAIAAALVAAPAEATPVCTDGYMGGPPASQCGGRIFPEAHLSQAYVQYTANPAGFIEYQHGIEYLAQRYERWISISTLAQRYGDAARSAGPDEIRAGEPGDSGDGREIQAIKLTDHSVPDAGKRTMLFSLSIHGNERGGLEGGLRAAEDLAMAATDGGKITDGIDNYESTTGRKPVFHEHEVRDLLARTVVYLVDLNPDGWAVGDFWNPPAPSIYSRGNSIGTDLNRQMPTVGRINPSRNPLQENEARYGERFMRDVAEAGQGRLMHHGADIHGELTSQAYVDIMYPAGQFDSVDHRRLMAIAERTKSVIDATLYEGIVDEVENADGGDEAEGSLKPAVPTKPAHWATVWDTLGYTDTGFLGDYMATDLAVTGMDYEFFLNHYVPEKTWNVYMQENHINGTRGIIKTALAYAPFQDQEFNDDNVVIDPVGRAGYVVNPDTVTDTDENGPGTRPGPQKDGIGQDGKPVAQRPYDVTNQRWFTDTGRLMPEPFVALRADEVAASGAALDAVDSLVLADVPVPDAPGGAPVDRAAYLRHLGEWVRRGGNLVLTDRALHALADLGVVPGDAVRDIRVYQPYANIRAFDHPMVAGLRPNARQLVEAPALGYGIGDDASPMTVVDAAAWEAAKGVAVATTGDGSGTTDDQSQVSVGEVALGAGKVRIVGGALPMPTEENDHRYGLRDYAMTYTALFVMENAIRHDVPGLGIARPGPGAKPGRCTRARKRVRVVLSRRAGRRAGRVRAVVAGRRAKVRRRGRRLVATVDLRRHAGRTVRLRVKRGRKVVQVKRIRVCARR